jgi:hypothetical protein
VAWIRARREHVERPHSWSGGQLAVPSVVSRLSSHEGIDLDNPREAFDLLAWILGPELERRALEAVARADYAEGPSTEERARRRAALDGERTRLVEEREGLVERLRADHVEIAHLPETQQRIEAHQRAEQRRTEERARQEEAALEIEERERRRGGSAILGRMRTLDGEVLGG